MFDNLNNMSNDSNGKMTNSYFEIYTIDKGDSIYGIARKYNINPMLLSSLNGLNMEDYIYPGQQILIPKGSFSYYMTAEGDTLSSVADTFGINKDTLLKENDTIYLLAGQLLVHKKKLIWSLHHIFFMLKLIKIGVLQMILKKPYAFLIKHFRLIHLILTVPLIYLIYKTSKIVTFFREYVANNYSPTVNGAYSSMFINPLMYFSIIFVLIAILAVYFLFKYKNKPRKQYIAIIAYYLLLFVLFTITHSILKGMENDVISASSARSYRDISLIISLPQYYFTIFMFVRGLGFNIKKLNFASDLKELEIAEADNEEFEFVVGVDSYKAKRTFRRFLREFGYYIRENTFVFIIIGLIIAISIASSFYFNKEDYNKSYNQGKTFSYQSFKANVKDSILTNLAYNGDIINKDNYYLAIKFNLKNIYNTDLSFKYNDFRLSIGKETLYPILDKASYFSDYAMPYNGTKIKAGSDLDYVLVYEIPKELIKKNFTLKIYNGFNTKEEELKTKYINVRLSPVIIDKTAVVNTISLGENLNFGDSNIGGTNITINNYQVANQYFYEYEKCYSSGCGNYKDVVSVDYSSGGVSSTLLILNYNLNLDLNTTYANYIKSEKAFFNSFVSVSYEIDGTEYKSTAINKTPDTLKNTLVLQVNSEVSSASQIKVKFTIRNKIYVINLKK